MITAITIWLIGWLFCVGVVIKADGSMRDKIVVVVLLVPLWPVFMGSTIAQNL